MNGVILLGLRKFVRERFGEHIWTTVQNEAGITDRVYLPTQNYPGEDLIAIVASVSRLSGMSRALLLESFGDTIAADLLRMYASLVDPKWKLVDVLVHGENILERIAARSGDPRARSPISGRLGRDGEVILTYESPLALCPMVKGIVRGIASHLEQPVLMDELRCMTAGSSYCEFAVRPERALNSERPHSLRRRSITPPPVSVAAVKAALIADRSEKPPSMPPSSGVTLPRTSPSSSRDPNPTDEIPETPRRR